MHLAQQKFVTWFHFTPAVWTFATNIYKMDILSLAQLRSLTGHGTEAMLMKYLNVSQSEISEKATERLQEAFAQ